MPSARARTSVRHDGYAGVREAADERAAGWERVLGSYVSYLEAT
jgi:hypothetical protein